jgi:hypothetical protein
MDMNDEEVITIKIETLSVLLDKLLEYRLVILCLSIQFNSKTQLTHTGIHTDTYYQL